jgi:hypothetical protein
MDVILSDYAIGNDPGRLVGFDFGQLCPFEAPTLQSGCQNMKVYPEVNDRG